MGISATFHLTAVDLGDVAEPTAEDLAETVATADGDERTVYRYRFGDRWLVWDWSGRDVDGDWWMLGRVAALRGVPGDAPARDAVTVRDRYARVSADELRAIDADLRAEWSGLVGAVPSSAKDLDTVIERCHAIAMTVMQIAEVLSEASRRPGSLIYYHAS